MDLMNRMTQLVVWPQDCGCDRKWLLEKVEGAAGLVVMLTDKVNRTCKGPLRDQGLNF